MTKRCARCGKTLYYRCVGYNHQWQDGELVRVDVFRWVARRGSKPAPATCYRVRGLYVSHEPVDA